MSMMRTLLADRFQNGMAVLLIAYLLLLQGMLAAMATGAMAAPGGYRGGSSPLIVLCSGRLAASDTAPEGGNSAQPPIDCPCATLCRLAGTATPVTLHVATAVAHPVRFATRLRYARLPARAVSIRLGRPRQARAPPAVSL